MRIQFKSQKRTFVRAHAPSRRRSLNNFATMIFTMQLMPSKGFAILRGREDGFPTP
jgi:hypothetical protein